MEHPFRAIRLKQGLSLRRLAHLINMPINSLSAKERGLRPFKPEEEDRCAWALGVQRTTSYRCASCSARKQTPITEERPS